MRGTVVLIIILGSLPFCLSQPWIGVLMYSWISYMNPHRYAWGPARDFPVALIVALTTLIGLAFTRDKSSLTKDGITVLMLLLWVVFAFTTIFAINRDDAFAHFLQTSKIWLMILVSVLLINNPKKLRYLILVIALSLGLIGIKGGIWALTSGGANRVYGPDGTFISDNNDVALAFNMALPLMLYLSKDEKNYWLRMLLKTSFALTIVATIFTYSRGGFLALAVVGFLLLVKARYKSLAIVLVTIAVVLGTLIVPAQWSERMGTIQTYQEDRSAMGRINAWRTALNLALDRPLVGGGFEALLTGYVFRRYAPDPDDMHDVHSIYFEMLGEQGFIGFALYLILIGSSFTTLMGLKRLLRRNPEIEWARYYPDMLQVSMIAYLVGGSFLGRAYFDMFYQLLIVISIMRRLLLLEVLGKVKAPAVVVGPVGGRAPIPAAVGWRAQT
jgi:probable O-glycosylation ligase (exosortase A-associated)